MLYRLNELMLASIKFDAYTLMVRAKCAQLSLSDLITCGAQDLRGADLAHVDLVLRRLRAEVEPIKTVAPSVACRRRRPNVARADEGSRGRASVTSPFSGR